MCNQATVRTPRSASPSGARTPPLLYRTPFTVHWLPGTASLGGYKHGCCNQIILVFHQKNVIHSPTYVFHQMCRNCSLRIADFFRPGRVASAGSPLERYI